MEDLTPIQEMFLIYANNVENEETESVSKGKDQKLSNDLQEKIKNKIRN